MKKDNMMDDMHVVMAMKQKQIVGANLYISKKTIIFFWTIWMMTWN